MKRPWLLTKTGQRLTMLLATVITIALIPLAVSQIETEQSRIAQTLIPGEVEYCEIANCGKIKKLAGLEVIGIESIIEEEFGTLITIRVLNHGMLVGEREVWAELRTQAGERIESMRGILQLSLKGPQLLELFFTGDKAEFQQGKLLLGF